VRGVSGTVRFYFVGVDDCTADEPEVRISYFPHLIYLSFIRSSLQCRSTEAVLSAYRSELIMGDWSDDKVSKS
jgi:hypothetical protein